jgi:glycosyltransferase involved in cell wall biosynthesis
MRILAITNLYPNALDPCRGLFNRAQFHALAAEHDVRVISPISWVEELTGRLAHRGQLPGGRRATHDGVVVEYPRYVYPPRVLRHYYGHCYRRSIRPAFARALAEFRPDVVLATWAYPDGWAAVELGHAAELPVVVKVHGCDVLWGLRRTPDRLRRTREALCRADAVVAVSQDLARHVVEFGVDPDRVKVVYNGVDTARFHPGPRDEALARLGLSGGPPLVLCVANLFPVKGIDVLIGACARLAAAGVPFRCRVIGAGPQRPELQRQIDGLNLGPPHRVGRGQPAPRAAGLVSRGLRVRARQPLRRRPGGVAGSNGLRRAVRRHSCRRHSRGCRLR